MLELNYYMFDVRFPRADKATLFDLLFVYIVLKLILHFDPLSFGSSAISNVVPDSSPTDPWCRSQPFLVFSCFVCGRDFGFTRYSGSDVEPWV